VKQLAEIADLENRKNSFPLNVDSFMVNGPKNSRGLGALRGQDYHTAIAHTSERQMKHLNNTPFNSVWYQKGANLLKMNSSQGHAARANDGSRYSLELNRKKNTKRERSNSPPLVGKGIVRRSTRKITTLERYRFHNLDKSRLFLVNDAFRLKRSSYLFELWPASALPQPSKLKYLTLWGTQSTN